MDRVDTRGALLDHATRLVRTRGYAAFSYADLAAAVGIRKASVHHHFATKELLGVELVSRYTERFQARLADIDHHATDPVDALHRYAALYREGLSTGEACLCGVIAAEVAAVPPAVAAGVADFFHLNRTWLTTVIESGKHSGVLNPSQPPPAHAATFLSTMQGATLIARAHNDPPTFTITTTTAIAMLTTDPGPSLP
ncbi:TetR/AcrR family transcriptional regulator [Actinokineospora globicatena]|uniref:TetR/AcrR family transcriptional regulator n=1 Tax=Actinokineospora globicatena TaxID=103729 RepID=UPI0020A5BF62|nr:TetR/AcrR family transcriptional regulator [Actinokineospora globicatena]MCP2302938.1 transcriptional regulator, TetR family [Actinokineospora globicatena]GLW78675.1 TetR family transcriptional regulator [Actinokineospora globicatena]GLW84657.1 TetR family transcriptional regulator [Actinokineospora globicatena]